jgi:hypothetical protein
MPPRPAAPVGMPPGTCDPHATTPGRISPTFEHDQDAASNKMGTVLTPLNIVGQWLRHASWFFADLKRRRVFRTMAIYGATSFIALEALSLLQPVLMVSDFAYRVPGFLLLAGFPVAMLMAWMYDYDTAWFGRQRQHATNSPPSSRPRDWDAGLPEAWPWAVSSFSPSRAGTPLLHRDPRFAGHSIIPSWRSSRSRSGARNRRTSISVMALHDDVLVQLSSRPPLGVISRTSAVRFRDTNLSLSAIADSLGASAILEGAVQRSGDTVRVTMQLIDARTDEHLWAAHWDEPLTRLQSGGECRPGSPQRDYDARGNWWGDPAGPDGPDGDGRGAGGPCRAARNTRAGRAVAAGFCRVRKPLPPTGRRPRDHRGLCRQLRYDQPRDRSAPTSRHIMPTTRRRLARPLRPIRLVMNNRRQLGADCPGSGSPPGCRHIATWPSTHAACLRTSLESEKPAP